MSKRRLPIGIQTFRKIRAEDCYYVDKTAYIQRLLDEGTHYFLSRPRRFGKSLFLDTLKELFEGNEPLFAGLHIHDHWDWSVRHPVLRLDFSSGTYQGPDDLQKEVAAQLNAMEEEAEVVPRDDDTAPARFRRLMKVLHERSGQRVAVLVNEYDKPILDALDTPEVVRTHRDFLLGLYSVIKGSDAHIYFTFLTGVSKYRLLEANDFAGLGKLFHAFFASIPYEWYSNNDIARYEGYYASVFYSYFAALGLNITVEDSSSHGRLDMAVLFNGTVYLFEFKVVELSSAGAAMAQLQERCYADKYRGLGQPIYLIGVEFSKDERNVAAFDVERA